MNLSSAPLAVLRVPYMIVRLPLQLIEQQVMSRLSEEAPVRLVYERTLGALDGAVGSVLGDRRAVQRGAALTERSDALARAAELDEQATQKREAADAELQGKQKKAREDQVAAQRDKQRKTEQARKDEERRKRQAAQQATRRAATAKKQADEQAAKRKQDAEAAKRAEQVKINAREQEAAAPATAELKDATAMKTAATEQRSDADRVENLAQAEKDKRQSTAR